jgi:hypothetical protein
MGRQFSSYFDAVMFYEGLLEKCEGQILTLLKERNDLKALIRQNRLAHNQSQIRR